MGFDNECILDVHSVAGEYFCPVCRTLVYPNEALQTPCTHLYCKLCLVHIARSTQACPYDGYLVTEAGSKSLVETNKALAEAIWKIAVRCLYHMSGCMWQGSLSECTTHRTGCAFGNSLLLCKKCGIEIPHRQAEDHAQLCNVNQVMDPQPQQGPQNVWDAATSGAALSIDQSNAAIQAGVPTSQLQASQTAPAQNLSQPAIVNPQPQALPALVVSTSEQCYQLQHQKYYQQYPVSDAYQQVYQQIYPHSLQATQQFHQPPLQRQIQPSMHVELQSQLQPLPQPQAELHPTQAQDQPQLQSQLLAQPQISFCGQPQLHLYPRAAMPGSNQNQAQLDSQQQIQPAILPRAQILTQNQLPTHSHMPPQLYLQAQPHVVQGHAQQHMQVQVPQFQQSLPPMHHPQPSLLHPHPQSQSQFYPQGYPLFQPHPQVQPPHMQRPPLHSVAGHDAYASQPHMQIMQVPPQQHPLQVQPSTASVPPGQVPAQFAQPPAHLHPLEPPHRLTSRGQAPGLPLAQHINPHSQPGLPVNQQPVLHQVQQPMPQHHVQLPQVFSGYTSGPPQGQLHHTGPSAQQHSQACPVVPPRLMQQPPLGYVQPQQGATLTHDMQPHSSQSHVGRPATLNQPAQLHQLPQSSIAAPVAAHARPAEFGSSQPSVSWNSVNMINQVHSLSGHQHLQSEPSLGGEVVERKGDQTFRRTKQEENKPHSLKNSDMDANGSGSNLNEIKPGADTYDEHKPENRGEYSYRQAEAGTQGAVSEFQEGHGVSCHPITTKRLKVEGKSILDHSLGGKMVQNKAADVADAPVYFMKQGEGNMDVQPTAHLRPPRHGHFSHSGQVSNLAEPFHPPGPDQPGSFYPQYQLGGSVAPCSAAMLARGPITSANHARTFEPQYARLQRQYSHGHVSPHGPPGFVSSSAPVLYHEQAPIGNYPDAFPMVPAGRLDQGIPHHKQFFGDSFGTKSTHPHLSEPGLRSSYTCQGLPNDERLYAGDSDSFDNLRRRKSTSMGLCRICKVDCESVEALEIHGKTDEHLRVSMDMANNIKRKAASMAKTSYAHSGLEEASNTGNAMSRGCETSFGFWMVMLVFVFQVAALLFKTVFVKWSSWKMFIKEMWIFILEQIRLEAIYIYELCHLGPNANDI